MSAKTLRECVVFGPSCFLALLLVLFCFPPDAGAQVLYGSLTGTVTDASEAGIPTAKVEATNANTGVTKQTTTDSRGVYLFNDLQPGTYAIKITAASFGAISQQGVAVNANTVQRLDAKLQLSSVTETVTVEVSAFTLQTDRADLKYADQNDGDRQPANESREEFPTALQTGAGLHSARRFKLRRRQTLKRLS
jgi:hypothetical protein